MKTLARCASLITAALFSLVGAAPATSFNVDVVPVNGGNLTVTPIQADSLVAMTGVDTHFGALAPYTSAPVVKAVLDGSNFRHVRDGGPGALPPTIGNTIALNADKANPFKPTGDGRFSETESSTISKFNAPNGDYVELCGNELDNDPSLGSKWPAALASCVATEVGWITKDNLNTRHLPIIAPSLITPNDAPAFASALGANKNLIDYANFHPGSGSFNPTYRNVQSTVASGANGISRTGAYFVTEWGFSDRKIATLVRGQANFNQDPARYYVTGHIYNRVNGLPESVIAAYDVRSMFEWMNAGAARMYFYQFADVPSDCTFGAQGLITANISNLAGGATVQDDTCGGGYQFTNTATLKPEYSAVNNTLGLFEDQGAPFTPVARSINLATSSGYVHHLVAQKRNGLLLVALWREENDYDWEATQFCEIGTSAAGTRNDYPFASPTSHQNQCKVTNEWANVSVPGYTESRVDSLQPNGSYNYATSGVSGQIPLATPYPVVVEFTPS